MSYTKTIQLTEGIKPSLLRRQKRRDKRMAEEVIECYRAGTAFRKSKHQKKWMQNTGMENLPSKESIKFIHTCISGNTKFLNDNLSPLKRYLLRNVGNDWSKVYSFLSQNLDKRTVSGLHVIQHLWDFIPREVFHVNGNVFCAGYREIIPLESSEIRPRFYIEPETGILRKAPMRKAYPRKRSETKRWIIKDHLHRYCQIKGNWFEFSFEYIKENEVKYAGYDGLVKEVKLSNYKPYLFNSLYGLVRSSPYNCFSEFGDYIFPKEKRQLNKKEIKKLLQRNSGK